MSRFGRPEDGWVLLMVAELSSLCRLCYGLSIRSRPQRLRRQAPPMVSGRMYCEEGGTRRSNEPFGREFDGGKGDAQKPGPEGTVPDKTRRP